jgi:FkbM family methyltransferase
MIKLIRDFWRMRAGYRDDRRLFFAVVWFWLKLLVGNRFERPQRAGSVSFLGKPFWYSKRGSLYSMFYEIFVELTYFIPRTDKPIRIVDCGANVGIATRYFLARAPHARITLFEPNPHTVAILQKNLAPFASQVSIEPVGLGREAGEFELHTDVADPASQGASINSHLKAKNYTLESVPVHIQKLSSYITDTVDVLKMDIEGPEVGVVRELKDTGVLSHVQTFFIEYHYDGVYSKDSLAQLLGDLESAGFVYVMQMSVTFPFLGMGRPITKCMPYKITAWRNS